MLINSRNLLIMLLTYIDKLIVTTSKCINVNSILGNAPKTYNSSKSLHLGLWENSFPNSRVITEYEFALSGACFDRYKLMVCAINTVQMAYREYGDKSRAYLIIGSYLSYTRIGYLNIEWCIVRLSG